MKNLVQLFICVIVLAHGTLLSEQISQITVGNAVFTCEHYTGVEQSQYLSRESFDGYLPTIIQSGNHQIERELDNQESTFTVGELSVQDYILAYYNLAYARFQNGKNQALVLLSEEQKCVAIIFFSVDESFDKALYVERQIVLAQPDQILQTQIPELLNNMTKLIAAKICIDAKLIITALPKGAKLLASFMQRVGGYAPCEYTGKEIDLEEKDVYAKLIVR